MRQLSVVLGWEPTENVLTKNCLFGYARCERSE